MKDIQNPQKKPGEQLLLQFEELAARKLHNNGAPGVETPEEGGALVRLAHNLDECLRGSDFCSITKLLGAAAERAEDLNSQTIFLLQSVVFTCKLYLGRDERVHFERKAGEVLKARVVRNNYRVYKDYYLSLG